MEAKTKTPVVFLKGIDKVIKRDLQKHKFLLGRSKIELLSYKEARSHEIKKRKHYGSLIGGKKYSDDSLKKAMGAIAVNIRHMSDKVKLSEEAIEHHTLIVDTLTTQLSDYNKCLANMAGA